VPSLESRFRSSFSRDDSSLKMAMKERLSFPEFYSANNCGSALSARMANIWRLAHRPTTHGIGASHSAEASTPYER
jgi:hypothetical protein